MKKIFLILGLTALFALPSYAELTVKDTVDANCMKNQGYSTALINATQKSVAQANREPLTEPVEHEYYNQPVIKAVRRFFMYLDPSYDDHTFMNDHDIHTSPSYEDL
jgi:hypothetical protein